MSYHELTNKLNKTMFPAEADKTVREWLERKAAELESHIGAVRCNGSYSPDVKEILGLREPSPAPCEHEFDAIEYDKGAQRVVCYKCNMPKPEPERVWCEHMKFQNVDWYLNLNGGEHWGEWRYCPICGKERPAEKPRTLELWEILQGEDGSDAKKLAKISKAWFREKVEKQQVYGNAWINKDELKRVLEEG